MLKEELAARFGVEVALSLSLSLSLSLLTTPPSALKVQSFSARCKFLWALFFSCIYEALQGVASSRSPPLHVHRSVLLGTGADPTSLF